MKRMVSVITGAAVVCGVATGVFSDALSQNVIRPEQKILRVIPQKPLVLQRSLVRYQAVPMRTLDRNGARQILERLQKSGPGGVGFEKAEMVDGRYIFTSPDDPSAVCDVDAATGSFLVNFGLKRYSGEGSTRNLPSGNRAVEIARSYLSETGYLPANENEMVVAGVGGLDMAVARDGKQAGRYRKLVTVRFSRVLNGMPVQGPGSRMVVHLGENSTPAGMIRNWTEVKAVAVSKEQLKSSEAVRGETAERLRSIAGKAREVRGEKSVRVLYDDGRGNIEPAMYVTAEAMYAGPKQQEMVAVPVDFYVPLLRNPKALYPFMKERENKVPGGDSRQRSLRLLIPRSGSGEQSDQK
ncbi:hypothetical protein [Prosthecochloris sp. ZM_2]|uniref:hypothetical protein n=1 Tax=Prosthecochloris sp. ZM_2 TaxID=2045206 RepID=UPI000F07BFA7|nr:hypothetical protein [Prosthecochloris sp. ZM_2]